MPFQGHRSLNGSQCNVSRDPALVSSSSTVGPCPRPCRALTTTPDTWNCSTIAARSELRSKRLWKSSSRSVGRKRRSMCLPLKLPVHSGRVYTAAARSLKGSFSQVADTCNPSLLRKVFGRVTCQDAQRPGWLVHRARYFPSSAVNSVRLVRPDRNSHWTMLWDRLAVVSMVGITTCIHDPRC